MKYSKQEVMQYVAEEDVKFIRLAFCDVFGIQKNISIMPGELSRAFEYGIAFDASSIAGFGDEKNCDLLLHPEPDTLSLLPWRPEHGKVVRMFANITYPDGRPFECDTRSLLKRAVADAAKRGYHFDFGAEQEFYLFHLDENGKPTKTPYDEASYMDIAPDDRGENIRREICLTLEQMGILPESSHHEAGPGQNEVDFRYSDAVTAADNTITFQNIAKIVARRNGLFADFSAKPLADRPGNGFHINVSVKRRNISENFPAKDSGSLAENNYENDSAALSFMIAGILAKIADITAFLNPTESSYQRFGQNKAPKYISWSRENRSHLIRIPAAIGKYRRAELRSPDPAANPYLAFALIIYAGLYGISYESPLPEEARLNSYTADPEILNRLSRLPESLEAACQIACGSSFVEEHLPSALIDAYCRKSLQNGNQETQTCAMEN